jgi:cyclophilin family peptidyl-prolyl cis-trans isomerase
MRRRGHLAGVGTAIGRSRALALSTLAVLAVMAIGATVAFGGSVQAIPAIHTCKPASAKRSHPAENLQAPPQTVSRRDHLVAIVETNCGRFEIQLDARRSPKIVNSFVYLARSGFYDGLLFYRVASEFVIQGGDPRNNGSGGPGYRVTERPPSGFHYRVGTVAMAKNEEERPGEAGSDFFVVTGQASYIANEYAVLGQIRAGRATIERIAQLATRSERPSQVVRIDSIRIKRSDT